MIRVNDATVLSGFSGYKHEQYQAMIAVTKMAYINGYYINTTQEILLVILKEMGGKANIKEFIKKIRQEYLLAPIYDEWYGGYMKVGNAWIYPRNHLLREDLEDLISKGLVKIENKYIKINT